jgi:peptidoglycan/LPS O-acetylase OafA/YrhL
MALKDVLLAMEQIGFTQVVLPFIIVFIIVFGTLQKTKVLGVDSTGRPRANYNAMVALVLAFFVLVMAKTMTAIHWFTRYAVVLVVAFVFIGMLFALVGMQQRYKGVMMFIALILVSFVFLQALAYAGIIDPGFVTTFAIPLLVAAFILGLGYFAFRRPPGKPEQKPKPKKKEEIPGIEKVGEVKKGAPAEE